MDSRRLWLAFAAVTSGTFMINVDSSIVNVALPTFSKEFHLSVSLLQWIVTVYLLVITAILPAASKIADVFGRRRIFALGIVVFIGGSAFCGLSHDFVELIAARAVQGLGAAIIQANVMSIVSLMFHEKMRGRALGTIGSVVAGGTLLGPGIGGVLLSAFGWQSIFFINVPIGLLGLYGTLRYVPRFPAEPIKGQFDWAGGVLFALSTWTFLTAMADLSGRALPLRDTVLGLIAVGTAVLFIYNETHTRDPILDISIFRSLPFSMAAIAGWLYWVIMLFPAFLVPLYLAQVMHDPSWKLGLMMMPMPIAMLVVSPLGGYLTDRIGTLIPAMLGAIAFIAADLWMLSIHPGATPLAIMAGLVGQGIAAGLFMSPNNTEIFLQTNPAKVGVVGGFIATERNFGRSVGVTLAALSLAVGLATTGGVKAEAALGTLPPSLFAVGFDFAFGVATGLSIVCLLLVVLPRWLRRRTTGGTGNPGRLTPTL